MQVILVLTMVIIVMILLMISVIVMMILLMINDHGDIVTVMISLVQSLDPLPEPGALGSTISRYHHCDHYFLIIN